MTTPTTEQDTRSPHIQALERAIEQCGGASALASSLKVSANAPSMWKARDKVPAEYCPGIERITSGAVRCEELRPDIAWGVLRTKVVKAKGAPPVPAHVGQGG